ncbi:MAG: hypothetical protein E4G94_01320 [ANME-2 cluster archaeon]|nr:MAG: hypothetical protein E4G94_01320 [ANME-2 cluster archaeon]
MAEPGELRHRQQVGAIQELLGHKSSKTTEIYTHVSDKDICKIKIQLDSLPIKGGEDDRR